MQYGGIAQLVRALASHARGRRFESYCLYQFDGSLSGRTRKEVKQITSFSYASFGFAAKRIAQKDSSK